MRLRNIKDVESFKNTVNSCVGDAWLESPDGDRINLKSELAQYIAISKLLKKSADRFELFCSLTEDEQRFFELFNECPEILATAE